MSEDWNAERMAELAHRHARLEAEQKLEPLLETLVDDPVYEFHPSNLRMRGGDTVRRYYDQFFRDFMSKIEGYELIDEWVNERSVAQEYDITVRVDGALETHRVIGILFAEGDRLGGERIISSQRIVELFCGEMIDELTTLR